MSCLDRGVPLGLDNKISRPSASFVIKGTQKVSEAVFEDNMVKTFFKLQISTFRNSHLEVFCKKSVLKFSQNSQENTCVRASFLIKLQVQVFSCEFCEIFKNTFLYRTPPVAAAVLYARESKPYTNIFIINISFPKWP